MKKEKFNEIIDFAVEAEKEAVEFYSDLQTKTKFTAIKDMLKEFENFERGHIVQLENIRKEGLVNLVEKEIHDLTLSDYLVEIEPTDDMSFEDIILIAMKREEAAKNLYQTFAAKMAGTEVEKLLLRLAADESEHKLKFEKIYDDKVLRDN
ncbi:MAG: ferritin family protein [Candidatus Delongbacteria bacterium]|jgi:rubrerythrin|nr:ferritin family protein [Candidatus Delongbacteria bacterium]